jgi:hypothetical protein
MGQVIKFPEVDDDDRGYLVTDDKEINGIYAENVCAMVDNGNVYLGTKGIDQIDDALLTSKKNLNDFCLRWLAIFNPDVLKYDEE